LVSQPGQSHQVDPAEKLPSGESENLVHQQCLVGQRAHGRDRIVTSGNWQSQIQQLTAGTADTATHGGVQNIDIATSCAGRGRDPSVSGLHCIIKGDDCLLRCTSHWHSVCLPLYFNRRPCAF
jgi:hypothetical protein